MAEGVDPGRERVMEFGSRDVPDELIMLEVDMEIGVELVIDGVEEEEVVEIKLLEDDEVE